jgi:hypothetical protein
MTASALTPSNEHPAAGLQPHGAAIERVTLTYLLAARDAARDSVPYAMAAFGLPQTLGQWLATADVEAVIGLAKLPVCAFAVRVPPQALERACGRHPGRAGVEDGRCAVVLGLHTVLKAVDEKHHEHA